MEAVLREQDIPLYSLENYRGLGEFDCLGFSLQNETSYTNLLNMLDLSRITLRSAERLHGEPVIIAGGTGAVTPEPLAEFVDCFLLGEGEEALPAFLHLLGVWRGRLDALVLDRYRPDGAFSRRESPPMSSRNRLWTKASIPTPPPASWTANSGRRLCLCRRSVRTSGL